MGLFDKIFGSKKDSAIKNVRDLVDEVLQGVMDRAQLELSYEFKDKKKENAQEDVLFIEMFGSDEEALLEKDGQLLEAFQLFLKRVIQHHFPESLTEVVVDCDGFREENNKALVDLAEKLKGIALEKGKSVYFRALPPKDRKVIHQYLADDERVKSRSIGDGLYKKIKIYPIRQHQD